MTYKLRGSVVIQNQKPRFFEFDQNNSGGSFHIKDEYGIGPRVWIEARSSAEADRIAEEIGIYFNGVEMYHDCSCCGDRWYHAYGEGQDVIDINENYDYEWHDTVYVHHLDGRIERIKKGS